MKKRMNRFFALVLCIVLAASFCMTGCISKEPEKTVEATPTPEITSQPAQESSSPDEEQTPTPTAEAEPEPEDDDLFGSPWLNSVVIGNLPSKAPDVKDDLYTAFDYDLLKANQDDNFTYSSSTENELHDTVMELIGDTTVNSHDLELLRIFYGQATDTGRLKETGFSEVQPYIDMIDATSSLEGFNSLLVSDEFPFSPFLDALLTETDTEGDYQVAIYPNFLFLDAILFGSDFYQDEEDPAVKESYESYLLSIAGAVLSDASLIGIAVEDYYDTAQKLIAFEKSYGKYLDTTYKYTKAEYGAMAENAKVSVFSYDELAGKVSGFPIKGALSKLKKDGSELYVYSGLWLEKLDELWTSENLEMLKLVAKVKVLHETRHYRDRTVSDEYLQINPDPEEHAYEACDSLNTLAQVIAKTYVDKAIGTEGRERLLNLTNDIIDVYLEMVEETPWINETSRDKIMEKLENMQTNVLEPSGGYFDYSALELTPTNEGGTLMSNYLKLKEYRYECEEAMIGIPADEDTAWLALSPTIVNAFYDPDTNSINIMPGIVTSAVYSADMDNAELLGNIGTIIGHEISHGLDYSGSQKDGYGRPDPVYTGDDLDDFLQKCSRLAGYYDGMEVLPGITIDGQTVVGEAAADLVGVQVCLMLLEEDTEADYEGFFKSYAQLWTETIYADSFILVAKDAHPASILRVNVGVQMFDLFYDIYDVHEGDGMYLAPEDRICIWGKDS